MNDGKVLTRYGEVTYHYYNEADIIRFGVKLKNERSENEFVVPVNFCPDEPARDNAVRMYAAGYEQGRHRGMWEKAAKIRKLFDDLKMEMT